MNYVNKIVVGSLTCRQVEEFLMDYLDSRLDFWIRVRFGLHILMCSNCSKYMQEYKNTIALEKKIFEVPDDEAIGNVPDEILQAIMGANKSSK